MSSSADYEEPKKKTTAKECAVTVAAALATAAAALEKTPPTVEEAAPQQQPKNRKSQFSAAPSPDAEATSLVAGLVANPALGGIAAGDPLFMGKLKTAAVRPSHPVT